MSAQWRNVQPTRLWSQGRVKDNVQMFQTFREGLFINKEMREGALWRLQVIEHNERMLYEPYFKQKDVICDPIYERRAMLHHTRFDVAVPEPQPSLAQTDRASNFRALPLTTHPFDRTRVHRCLPLLTGVPGPLRGVDHPYIQNESAVQRVYNDPERRLDAMSFPDFTTYWENTRRTLPWFMSFRRDFDRMAPGYRLSLPGSTRDDRNTPAMFKYNMRFQPSGTVGRNRIFRGRLDPFGRLEGGTG
eukprot:TRINITY_DN23789_c0_g1_i1.p1 TRINITY_DN23789_c0_g1~~TRINITY_DN23789_c0_g1_i1.p1  ORF type:complete len:246 (-),score=28.52 TRINITY_DN23789_c0_g1_i1:126-863(-)